MSFEFVTQMEPPEAEASMSPPEADISLVPHEAEASSLALVPYGSEFTCPRDPGQVRKRLMKLAESAEQDTQDWAIIRSFVCEEVENVNWDVFKKIAQGNLTIVEMTETQATS